MDQLSRKTLLANFRHYQRGGRSEFPIVVGRLTDGELESGVSAEGLMVVEIFIARGEGDDPLGEHGLLVVEDQWQPARVRNGSIESVEESQSLADLSEQEDARIGGQPPPLKIGDDRLGAEAGKVEGSEVTVCHGDGLAF
jgi:hypothetical protein